MIKGVLVLTGIAFLATLVMLPLGYMSQYAFSDDLKVFWESISSAEALVSLRFSLVLALATTAINGVAGTVVAFALVRHQFPLKGFLDSLVDLPVAIPASATGLSILLLYGPFEILGKGFEVGGMTVMFAFPAILIVHVLMTLPLVVRAVGPALAETDIGEEEAAKILGANELQVFTNVILPVIKRGLISGCGFTFARSLGELGATILISGYLALRTQTAPLFIFPKFSEDNIAAANSMAVLLVIISLILFAGFKLTNKIVARKRTVDGKRGIAQES